MLYCFVQGPQMGSLLKDVWSPYWNNLGTGKFLWGAHHICKMCKWYCSTIEGLDIMHTYTVVQWKVSQIVYVIYTLCLIISY